MSAEEVFNINSAVKPNYTDADEEKYRELYTPVCVSTHNSPMQAVGMRNMFLHEGSTHKCLECRYSQAEQL